MTPRDSVSSSSDSSDTRYAGLVAALRDYLDELQRDACLVCGAEPGCNIDCGLCLWLSRLAALVADPPQEKSENVESQEKNISR